MRLCCALQLRYLLKFGEDFWLILRKVAHEFGVSEQPSDVSDSQHQIEMIGTIVLLDHLELTLEVGGLGLHPRDLLGGKSLQLFLLLFDKLILWRRRNQGTSLTDGVAVHGHHKIRGLDLSHRLQLAQLMKRVDRHMLVPEQVRSFRADALKQSPATADA